MMHVRERLLSIRLTERRSKQPGLADKLASELRTRHRTAEEKKTSEERKSP